MGLPVPGPGTYGGRSAAAGANPETGTDTAASPRSRTLEAIAAPCRSSWPTPGHARVNATRFQRPAMSFAARNDQAIDTLHEISNLLDTGLDKETLRILVGLCEAGVNPEALATVVKELRREAAAVRQTEALGRAK